jgi:hypothetical protein
MIAENSITKGLSIWADTDLARLLGIVSEGDIESLSTKQSWIQVSIIKNDWLYSTNGAVGAHFDAPGGLHDSTKRIGVDVLVEQADTSLGILRVEAYVRPGEVIVTSEWKVDGGDFSRVKSDTQLLLQKINAQACEIDNFLAVNGIHVSFNNPRGFIRRDFHWICSDSVYSTQPAVGSLLVQPIIIPPVPLLSQGEASGSRDASKSPESASSITMSERGTNKKRSYFQAEGMSTGVAVRGRRPGSKDTKKRERGTHLTWECYLEVLAALTKLIILEKSNCDTPSESRDTCNQNVFALFTITKVFDTWYWNNTSRLLNKRFDKALSVVQPLLTACPLLLADLSPEFCASVKDKDTMATYVALKQKIVMWFQDGCKCDFFMSNIVDEGESTCGSPSDNTWLSKNRKFLLGKGIIKLRNVNQAEMKKRKPFKLVDAVVEDGVRMSLNTLHERLASTQDNIVRSIRARYESAKDLDAEKEEQIVRATYSQFESVISKAVEIFKETSEVTERLKIVEQKRRELMILFDSTCEKSANFTRAYIPPGGYSPEHDVQGAVAEILRNASQTLITAPQFSGGGAASH